MFSRSRIKKTCLQLDAQKKKLKIAQIKENLIKIKSLSRSSSCNSVLEILIEKSYHAYFSSLRGISRMVRIKIIEDDSERSNREKYKS